VLYECALLVLMDECVLFSVKMGYFECLILWYYASLVSMASCRPFLSVVCLKKLRIYCGDVVVLNVFIVVYLCVYFCLLICCSVLVYQYRTVNRNMTNESTTERLRTPTTFLKFEPISYL
jgi:hypothetical protein